MEEIFNRILNRYAARFNVAVSELGDTIKVEAMVLAGLYYVSDLYISEAKKEGSPLTCSEAKLLEFGELKLGRLPYQASAGQYKVNYTGGVIGEIIQGGTTFKQNSGSGTYVIDADFTVTAEEGEFTVRALQGGLDTLLAIDAKITSVNPLLAVNDEVTVVEVTALPLTAEDIDSYRDEVVSQYQNNPQGGSIGDYRSWSSDTQGVRRVYPYKPTNYDGTILIYVEATEEDTEQGEPIGTPTTAIIADVKNVLTLDPDTTLDPEKRSRLPLSVKDLNVQGVRHADVVINISNISTPSSAIRTEIEEGISDYLYNIRPYQAGVDLEESNTIRRSEIERIVLNTGVTYDELTMLVNTNDVINYTVGDSTDSSKFGEIPYLQVLNYV